MAVVLALVSGAGPAQSSDLPQPPKLEVSFWPDPASTFARNLQQKTLPSGRTELDEAREKGAERLAGVLRGHFGFIVWRPVADEGAVRRGVVARLSRKKLREGVDTVVDFFWIQPASEGGEIRLHDDSFVLYRASDLRRAADGATLALHLGEILTSALKEDWFSEGIMDYLRGIPLATEILPADERVVILLDHSALNAGYRSVLRIQLVQCCAAQDGRIEVTSIERRWGAPLDGALQGVVKWLDCPPLPILDKLGAWDPEIPNLLSNKAAKRVFMEHYVRASNVVRGLVSRSQ